MIQSCLTCHRLCRVRRQVRRVLLASPLFNTQPVLLKFLFYVLAHHCTNYSLKPRRRTHEHLST